MKRRDFVISAAAGTMGLTAPLLPELSPAVTRQDEAPEAGWRGAVPRTIVLAGGGFGTTFIKYMASLTGKERPRLCFLPTASADRESGILRWYQNCAPLNVEPSVQESFISSYRMDRTFEEVLLSVDGIVVSGGNTLNQQVIWKAHGLDAILREAWDRGIVLGGASAGSLCWFEEGTTDSRPKELTKVECLGFLRGSHSPHYDAEGERRPIYQRMIASGEMKPGYACDNDAGIHFEDNEVRRVIATRAEARVYHVSAQGGRAVEREMVPELIS